MKSGNSEVSGQNGDMQTSSPSTEGSTNAYIERTFQEFSSQQEVCFLSPKQSVEECCRTEQEVSKTSESAAITNVSISQKANNNAPMESDVQDELVSEIWHFRTKPDFLQTDTSKVEDLYDSAGAVTVVNQPTFTAPGFCEPTSSERGAAAGDQADDVACGHPITNTQGHSTTFRLRLDLAEEAFFWRCSHSLANGTLNVGFEWAPNPHSPESHFWRGSCFIYSDHSGINRGNLKSWSPDIRRETRACWLTTPTLSLWKFCGRSRTRWPHHRWLHKRRSQLRRRFGGETGKATRVASTIQLADSASTEANRMIHSPGFTAADYQPLAQLGPPPPDSPRTTHPARKRKRMAGGTGKVMKEVYFKGFEWTKSLVTRLLDQEHNEHRLYSQICKTNISIFSKKAWEIVRHYQAESHTVKLNDGGTSTSAGSTRSPGKPDMKSAGRTAKC